VKKIALNAIALNEYSGGLGIYLQQLVCFFLKEETGLDLKIFLNKREAEKVLQDSIDNELLVDLDISSRNAIMRICKEIIVWPGLLKTGHYDLFHSPMSYFPFMIPIPAILTVHDLRSFYLKASYNVVRRKFLNQRIRESVKRANHIIAVSQFTKNGLMELFDIPGERISVIYEGIDSDRFRIPVSQNAWQLIQERYRLPENYILSVGHLEPRKNYLALLKAYLRLKEKTKRLPDLVIVGQENWDYEPIYSYVSDHGLQDQIHFTHFVDAKDLPAIYQKSLFFITTSLYEGFGFTPLEAMAAGTPVAYSNATSLPEIVGEAGLRFDPADPENIAEQMEQLIEDQLLREALILKGNDNLQRFNWDLCCRQTLDIYHQELP